jgi:Ca-activated chloride channel family protein
VIDVDGYSVSTALDSAQLEEISGATNGDFYEIADADSFAAIADGLGLEWRTEGERTEIAGLLAAVAGGLLIVSVARSAALLGRVI